jgi:hypothetical protein
MIAGLTLPTLTDAHPTEAGEGSIDPMGTGALADRIADQLVRDVRARMVRVRFLTAMAVGAIVTDEVGEVLIVDGRATPSLAFEWLLLEGFVRKNITLPFGVPGRLKAQGIRSAGKRLGAGSYLKAPGVFGFNGVYKPLATGIDLVTDALLPAARAADLVAAWEQEQNLPGFLSGGAGTAGGKVRRRTAEAVRAAVEATSCQEPERSPIWTELPHRLVPISPGPVEAALLRSWLVEHPVRGELARLIAPLEEMSEHELLSSVRVAASVDLGERIDAVLTYEALSAELDFAFQSLLWRSTHLNSSPLTVAEAAKLDAVREAAKSLPALFARAVDALAALDLHLPLEHQQGVFADAMSPSDLAAVLFERHHQVQAGKPPGKRSWFEPSRDGFVVRPPYIVRSKPERRHFVHPMRVDALHRFLEDTAA